jgi:hypothetical protein
VAVFLVLYKSVCGRKARIMAYRRLQLSREIPMAKAEELNWRKAQFIGP